MNQVYFVYGLAILNIGYAMFIYLTLEQWFFLHESSGMQAIVHIIITLPVVLVLSIWFGVLVKLKLVSPIALVASLSGLLIPLVSYQSGNFWFLGLPVSVGVLCFLIYGVFNYHNEKLT